MSDNGEEAVKEMEKAIFISADCWLCVFDLLAPTQLGLGIADDDFLLMLVRCPIARDKSKWTKWEEETIHWKIDDQWNIIDIAIFGEDEIGEGLLDATPGLSDQQQK
ncbi:hypothetical protein niasHT_011622 [Heterodera trifolii]|uniref:Uncharacterized protein n=1 Tax=Heterodera trifolii TaxID=157864 RepID=A0ABD2LH87_9BILA